MLSNFTVLWGLFQFFSFSFATHYFISLSMVSSEILQKDVSYKCRRITHLHSKKLLPQLFLSHISHWLTFISFPVVEPETWPWINCKYYPENYWLHFKIRFSLYYFKFEEYYIVENTSSWNLPLPDSSRYCFQKVFRRQILKKKWNSTLISTIPLVLLEKTSFRTPSKFSVLALPPNS